MLVYSLVTFENLVRATSALQNSNKSSAKQICITFNYLHLGWNLNNRGFSASLQIFHSYHKDVWQHRITLFHDQGVWHCWNAFHNPLHKPARKIKSCWHVSQELPFNRIIGVLQVHFITHLGDNYFLEYHLSTFWLISILSIILLPSIKVDYEGLILVLITFFLFYLWGLSYEHVECRTISNVFNYNVFSKS